jgi:hypothetical protein
VQRRVHQRLLDALGHGRVVVVGARQILTRELVLNFFAGKQVDKRPIATSVLIRELWHVDLASRALAGDHQCGGVEFERVEAVCNSVSVGEIEQRMFG